LGLKAIKSRIERLERRVDGGECNGCNLTVVNRVCCDIQRHERGEPSIEDWSGTEFARCPDCSNPNPKMSMRAGRQLWIDLAELRSKDESE
jgi:hypothetical protein